MSRKQRELAERHALFLSLAKRILDEEGFHLLSMERIAELAEYSKGTVYQHFTCKEEILIQLCIEVQTDLLELFQRVMDMDGSNRDRTLAFFYAHQHWCCSGGNKIDMLQHLSMHGVSQKVSEESLNRHEQLDQTIVALVKSVVDQAIDDGDLPPNKHLQSAEAVFGLWSMSTGGQLLQASDLPLEDFGIRNPDMTLLRTVTLILDGLKWQPMHNEADFLKLLERLETDVFNDLTKTWNTRTND